MSRILAVLLLVVAGAARAEVLTFEQAEWVAPSSWGHSLPQEHWTWTPVSLPHNWFRQPPTGTYGWYRMRFDLERVPAGGQSLYFPKLVLNDLNVYVNRQALWKLSETRAPGVSRAAVRIPIPPGLLQVGENTIHLEATGYSYWFQGVSRVYVGDTAALSRRAAMRGLSQGQMNRIVAAAFGAIGILSLWLWLRAGREPVLFWYGVSGITLLAVTVLWYVSQWRPEFVGWRVGLIFMRFHGYLVPLFILHLRLAGRRHLWLESALWMVLIVAFVSVAQPNRWGAAAWVGWGLAFAALPALLTIPLLMSPRLRARPAVLLLVVADYAASLLPLHDWAIRFGLLDFDRPNLVFFAPLFVMLAAAVPIVERMLAGARATERNRLELEQRVAEKIREAEASHEELRRAQRKTALAEERRRIMADMHDGLGARLVALLSVAQSGRAKHGEISEGLAAALDELRLTVDSVQPVEGDVSVVLGNVRHRMRSALERSGMRLVWNVSELPRMEDLTPERILAIQRIFLEAFTNALRHSRARTVSVFTMRVPGAVRIVIEDDGRGFDAGAPHAGTGLHNLQMRALQAGGTLQVESKAGKGTRVTLSLPLEGGQTHEPLPDTGQKAADYPVHGIAADPATS